jgi:hypothetical protein
MDDRISNICTEIEQVAKDAIATFGDLGRDQLNWKSSPKVWSIAQCFDHLITIDSLYFPIFQTMSSDAVANSFWETYSPLSGFFGRYLLKVLSPEYSKKIKTSKKAYPSASDLGGDIIQRFSEHQQQLAEYISRVSPKIDLKKMIITSPLLIFVTYSLDDALTILTVHERRHFDQAKRVMDADAFAD